MPEVRLLAILRNPVDCAFGDRLDFYRDNIDRLERVCTLDLSRWS